MGLNSMKISCNLIPICRKDPCSAPWSSSSPPLPSFLSQSPILNNSTFPKVPFDDEFSRYFLDYADFPEGPGESVKWDSTHYTSTKHQWKHQWKHQLKLSEICNLYNVHFVWLTKCLSLLYWAILLPYLPEPWWKVKLKVWNTAAHGVKKISSIVAGRGEEEKEAFCSDSKSFPWLSPPPLVERESKLSLPRLTCKLGLVFFHLKQSKFWEFYLSLEELLTGLVIMFVLIAPLCPA